MIPPIDTVDRKYLRQILVLDVAILEQVKNSENCWKAKRFYLMPISSRALRKA